jgi:plastocyanin
LEVSDQFTLIQPAAGSSGAIFLPLQLSAGNWMLWQNNDLQAHQPVPDTNPSSPPWPKNVPSIARFSLSTMIQFSTAGNYSYHCAAHPQEKGTITVSASQPS